MICVGWEEALELSKRLVQTLTEFALQDGTYSVKILGKR